MSRQIFADAPRYNPRNVTVNSKKVTANYQV